jgi:hypothetical protein
MRQRQLAIKGSATNGESFREVALEPRDLRFRCAHRGSQNVIAIGFGFLTGPFAQ